MPLPPTQANIYSQEKWGLYGELGEGSGVRIRFIQTTIEPAEFEKIKLVPEIQGSETWEVRDLFQREIDEDRVDEIIKYLKNKDDVKFFNPLTLVVLPMNEKKTLVESNTAVLIESTEAIENKEFLLFERENFFKINPDKDYEFAKISWNDRRCDIVAIDGQHRLAALKRMHKANLLDDFKWKIPVVLLIIEKIDDNTTSQTITILETVRRTFVNINEKSEHINKCRKILLDDSDLNAICVQELVQVSHTNDNKDFQERDKNILPLIFFEWRGVVKNRRPQPNPAYVKEIIEIKNWFETFLIGRETQEQKENLILVDMPYGFPVSLAQDTILTAADVAEIRKYVREDFIKGINNFLINFIPYKTYIEGAREIEQKALTQDCNDIRKYAFLKLRFGRHNAPVNITDEVDSEYRELITEYEALKNHALPENIKKDIGMRGIIFAFGRLKKIFNEYDKTKKWLEYSNEVLEYFNEVFKEGWFREHDDENIDTQKRNFLTYIMYNNAGSVQQYYKLENMDKQLGGFLVIILLSKMRHNFDCLNDNLSNILDNYKDNISKSYEKGFKDEFKSENRNDYLPQELNNLAKAYAAEKAEEKIKELFAFLGIDNA